jgi:hypothetical protein
MFGTGFHPHGLQGGSAEPRQGGAQRAGGRRVGYVAAMELQHRAGHLGQLAAHLAAGALHPGDGEVVGAVQVEGALGQAARGGDVNDSREQQGERGSPRSPHGSTGCLDGASNAGCYRMSLIEDALSFQLERGLILQRRLSLRSATWVRGRK